MRYIFFRSLVLVLLLSAPAFAEDYQEISAPEVKNMMENTNVKVIHVLSSIEYKMQHIPGSINIPVIKIKTSKLLPPNKNMPIIFYCMGHK